MSDQSQVLRAIRVVYDGEPVTVDETAIRAPADVVKFVRGVFGDEVQERFVALHLNGLNDADWGKTALLYDDTRGWRSRDTRLEIGVSS